MSNAKKWFWRTLGKQTAVASAGALVMATGGVAGAATTPAPGEMTAAQQTALAGSGFYCNIKALSSAERAHHKELTEKLLAERKESVETATGYEFQFRPTNVTLAELADWVGAESKCCPFLNFHIDLEAAGHLLCLRLTGVEGVKAFIRDEFRVGQIK